MTLQKRRIIFVFCLLVFFILSAVVLSYSQGYTVNDDLSFSQKGGLFISVPFPESEIFVDNEKQKPIGMLKKNIFLPNISAKEHTILVAKDGFWPWAKTLKVESGLVTEVHSFMVPKEPSGEIILKGSFSEIWDIPRQKMLVLQNKDDKKDDFLFYLPDKDVFLSPDYFSSTKIIPLIGNIESIFWHGDVLLIKNKYNFFEVKPDMETKTVKISFYEGTVESVPQKHELLSRKGDQKVWLDHKENKIMVDWLDEKIRKPYYLCEDDECLLPLQIFQSHLTIKNIEYYPQRRDVIMLAVGNGVYALEIDRRGERLLYPIYKGRDPNFTVMEESGDIFISDNMSLIKIELP